MSTAKKDLNGTRSPLRQTKRVTSTHVRKVREQFERWLNDQSRYDEKTWPRLKKALNENHSGTHNLFDA